MTTVTKIMDHAAYAKRVRKMSDDSLRHVIADCQEAMAANPDNPNNGYYADEVSYCSSELHRRAPRVEPSAAELIARADRKLHEAAQMLAAGFGDKTVSMTEATVALFGTSGRGHWRAVREIEVLAEYGFVRIDGSAGGKRTVTLTPKGLACGQ